MGINLSNFLSPQNKDSKMGDLQDLDHIDGVAISTISANLYSNSRDDLVMYYFRDGANYASAYTKSRILSENIKWNLKQKSNRIFSLLINTRNANAFTGVKGYQALQKLAEILSLRLTEKQKEDDNNPEKIKVKHILFGCTGTIGETFPYEKIKEKIPELISNINSNEIKNKTTSVTR